MSDTKKKSKKAKKSAIEKNILAKAAKAKPVSEKTRKDSFDQGAAPIPAVQLASSLKKTKGKDRQQTTVSGRIRTLLKSQEDRKAMIAMVDILGEPVYRRTRRERTGQADSGSGMRR